VTQTPLTYQCWLWYPAAMMSSAKTLSHIPQPDTDALTPRLLWTTQPQRMCFTHEPDYDPYYAVS